LELSKSEDRAEDQEAGADQFGDVVEYEVKGLEIRKNVRA